MNYPGKIFGLLGWICFGLLLITIFIVPRWISGPVVFAIIVLLFFGMMVFAILFHESLQKFAPKVAKGSETIVSNMINGKLNYGLILIPIVILGCLFFIIRGNKDPKYISIIITMAIVFIVLLLLKIFVFKKPKNKK